MQIAPAVDIANDLRLRHAHRPRDARLTDAFADVSEVAPLAVSCYRTASAYRLTTSVSRRSSAVDDGGSDSTGEQMMPTVLLASPRRRSYVHPERPP